jgi:hypothetical protein
MPTRNGMNVEISQPVNVAVIKTTALGHRAARMVDDPLAVPLLLDAIS